ncbi:MAG: cell division protein SepF [Candidatus Margulisbacteria bacterium]|nr:cell division protein SepF [Candidatus Margulisiibacteriota bacterium]
MNKKSNTNFFEQFKVFLGLEDMKEVNKKTNGSSTKSNGAINLAYFKKASSEIKIISPKSFADGIYIVEFIKQDIPVIVNLQYLNKMQVSRFMDFISGTIYSLNGNSMKLSDTLLMICSERTAITEENLKRTKSSNNANEEIVMNMMNVN